MRQLDNAVPVPQVGDSKPGFYAIASPPDPNNAGLVELLIKSVPGTTAEILAGSSAGAAQQRGLHPAELPFRRADGALQKHGALRRPPF